MKTYRNNGAIGAILDEYERSIQELINVISNISTSELMEIVDSETEDSDCRSIQTILTHIVRAGYNYAIQIQQSVGISVEFRQRNYQQSIHGYIDDIKTMFLYTESVFLNHPDMKLEEYEAVNKMVTMWGQLYDVEQLMEHAIVHILRHRRQIERFLIKIHSKR